MDIETQSKLLKLKGLLGAISHASFSYSRIEKENPMYSLSNEKAKQLIKAYESILADVTSLIMKNENKDNLH